MVHQARQKYESEDSKIIIGCPGLGRKMTLKHSIGQWHSNSKYTPLNIPKHGECTTQIVNPAKAELGR